MSVMPSALTSLLMAFSLITHQILHAHQPLAGTKLCCMLAISKFFVIMLTCLGCLVVDLRCSSSTSSSAGKTCPNDYVCLAVPQSSLALSGMTNGFYVQMASASILLSLLRWFLGLAS